MSKFYTFKSYTGTTVAAALLSLALGLFIFCLVLPLVIPAMIKSRTIGNGKNAAQSVIKAIEDHKRDMGHYLESMEALESSDYIESLPKKIFDYSLYSDKYTLCFNSSGNKLWFFTGGDNAICNVECYYSDSMQWKSELAGCQ